MVARGGLHGYDVSGQSRVGVVATGGRGMAEAWQGGDAGMGRGLCVYAGTSGLVIKRPNLLSALSIVDRS